ncbi:hypothetical protein [Streptomyces sp. CAU 1734]|uniref:hypothetical protein n=1 Tax=Streptomyces sp. CAU 1734 TaxID=3140360 RepID=UPI00326116D8
MNDETDPWLARFQTLSTGIKSVTEADWTPEQALAYLRENRRRFADNDEARWRGAMGSRLAERVVASTGVDPADAAAVLLFVGARIGALSSRTVLPAWVAGEVLQCAADDLYRKAEAGDAP